MAFERVISVENGAESPIARLKDKWEVRKWASVGSSFKPLGWEEKGGMIAGAEHAAKEEVVSWCWLAGRLTCMISDGRELNLKGNINSVIVKE